MSVTGENATVSVNENATVSANESEGRLSSRLGLTTLVTPSAAEHDSFKMFAWMSWKYRVSLLVRPVSFIHHSFMPRDVDALLDLLRRRQVATGRELRDALGISQPTLSRWVARSRDELVVLRRTRTMRSAARDIRSAFVTGVRRAPLRTPRRDTRVQV